MSTAQQLRELANLVQTHQDAQEMGMATEEYENVQMQMVKRAKKGFLELCVATLSKGCQVRLRQDGFHLKEVFHAHNSWWSISWDVYLARL